RPHTFSIGATDGATNAVVVPLMERLRSIAPEINVCVRLVKRMDVIDAIDHMHIDLALCAFAIPAVRLTRIPIRNMQFVAIARRDHPALRAEQPLTAARFAAL